MRRLEPPPFRAICFDLDGTLVHFTGDFEKFVKSSFAELGVSDEHRDAVLAAYLQQLRRDGAVTSLEAFAKTLERFKVRSDVDLERGHAIFVQAYGEQMALLPGAKGALSFCRRFPSALVTNGPEDMQRAAAEAVGIAGDFRAVLISGAREVGVRKPGARIFQLACEHLNVRPEEALMIGDTLEADVRGALNAGMQAVYVGSEKPEGIERVSLLELSGWLERRLP